MTINDIEQSIAPYQKQLLDHSLYGKINTIDDLNLFLEHHVFAVWDFMSLLKALQNQLTCTATPWIPVGNPNTRYLINEIVLAEETDLNIKGERQSHFEMYLEAMNATGASAESINRFLADLESSKNIFVTIKKSDLHNALKAFLNFTFEVAFYGKPHEIAAAFTFGREDLIPNMFTEILRNFQERLPNQNLSKLLYYFERHIELDEDEHGPMALEMINDLCGNDNQKWKEVETISVLALEKRILFWNAIESMIYERAGVLN